MEKIEIVDLYVNKWSDPWGKYINIEVEFPDGKTETIAKSIKTTCDDYEENYNKALNVAHALGYYLSGELENNEKTKRRKLIMELKDEKGLTFKAISEIVGIDKGSVGKIYRNTYKYSPKQPTDYQNHIKEMVDLRKKGWTYEKIAKKFNIVGGNSVSRRLILNYCEKNNIPLNEITKKSTKNDRKQEILELRNQGLTYRQIAKKLKISHQAVYQIVKKANES